MNHLVASLILVATAGHLLGAVDGPVPSIKVLFLGDNGAHRPADRFRQLQPILAKRGIDLVYTDKVEALKPEILSSYEGLVIYANTVKISTEQEKALLDFVESGKGFIPVHCASYCFLNSPKYVALVGAQFQKHGVGTFRATVAAPDHPIMKGYRGFESFDETYVHTKHNAEGRTILEYRVDGKTKEPWTWVRSQGKGRVFYTAWGHDDRTWSNPGFHDLIERGIRWAVGKEATIAVQNSSAGRGSPDPAPPVTAGLPPSPFDTPFPIPAMTPLPKDIEPFEYVDVGSSIPNYKPGKQGKPLNLMQKPLPASESQKHMVTPKGFRAEVFAADPKIRRPLCMNWDERGRLWIAESVDYPHDLHPSGEGNDRLVICEDADGDGVADRFTVFADKLSIPSGFVFHRGGVIVFEGRQTVYLKDTTGDDKADVRHVLFGDWAMGDTHGGPSNMHYGLDNWIWGMQGYNASKLTVGDETHQFRQGFFRFKMDSVKDVPLLDGRQQPLDPKQVSQGVRQAVPHTGIKVSRLEFLRSTSNNTWGLGFSEDGIVFGSTANGNPSVHLPIPNRYYEAVRGWAPSLVLPSIADSNRFRPVTDKVRQVDFHGGYTAAAGHALYTARAYPKEYWNRVAFVCEPTGHLVATFVLERDGATFKSSNPFNLAASDDEWTAPIMAEVGPDGAVWVLDWYNYIVQHNPTPSGFKTGKGNAYFTELRDKKHGRVYRIVHGETAKTKPFTLAGATPETLVATLKHDNMLWRKHAQRLLVERGNRDVAPALIKLVGDPKVDEIGLNPGAIHALWTLHGLGCLDGKDADSLAAAVAALKHPSPGVRRNAVQTLPALTSSVAAILDARLTQDPDPQVRLAALLALADLPADARAAAAIVDAMSRPEDARDRALSDAAICAAATNSDVFLAAFAGRKAPADNVLASAAIITEHYARGAPAETIGALVKRLADADPAVIDVVVRGLARGWPKTQPPKLDAEMEKGLAQVLARMQPGKRSMLIQLASRWGSAEFAKLAVEAVKNLMIQAADEKLPGDERIAAARELVEIQPADAKLVATLLELITPRTPPEVGAGIVQAVQQSQAADAGKLLAGHLAGFTPAIRAAAVSALFTRAEWTQAYLDLVEKGKLQLSELSLDRKQAMATHPDIAVRKRAVALLKKGGSLPNADRQKVIEGLIAITKEKGDPAAGKLVFKNVCAKCHVHSGEGTRIGPDLTGMAAHTKEHLLVEILDPSRSVEGNFRTYSVATDKGTLITGLLASESKTSIELFDLEGKKINVLRDQIETITASSKSLMPDGFESQLKRHELVDLLEFLTQRGKYLPLPLDRVATAVSTRGMFYSEASKQETLVFPDWKPKVFEGVPFHLVDPGKDQSPNVVLLYGPQGKIPPRMPKSVSLPCNSPAKAIHLLSGVGGWAFPYSEKGTVSLIVRLHYDDGATEDHALKNGEHFADYIRRVDVPGSKFAFNLGGRQIRYLAIHPKRQNKIERIELLKGSDATAPVVMAVTVEG